MIFSIIQDFSFGSSLQSIWPKRQGLQNTSVEYLYTNGPGLISELSPMNFIWRCERRSLGSRPNAAGHSKHICSILCSSNTLRYVLVFITLSIFFLWWGELLSQMIGMLESCVAPILILIVSMFYKKNEQVRADKWYYFHSMHTH